MRNSIKNAVGETVQDLVNSGIKVSFTKEELDSFGVIITKIQSTTNQSSRVGKRGKFLK